MIKNKAGLKQFDSLTIGDNYDKSYIITYFEYEWMFERVLFQVYV